MTAMLNQSLWISVTIAIVALIKPLDSKVDTGRCGSIDLRNKPNMAFRQQNTTTTWNHYLNCKIIDGDFTMALMSGDNFTEDDFPTFHNLREITGSMLIFQVDKLTNLGKVFPNLRVIGGHSLIMNYALVVYQNSDLETIGLEKLTTIRNGGVRITDNAKLCYARYINWNDILIGKIRDVIVDQGIKAMKTFNKNIANVTMCRDIHGCNASDLDECQSVDGIRSCWNASRCQKRCKYHRLSDDSTGPGCSDTGEKCHAECLGGCSVAGDPTACASCRNVTLNGRCIPKCPDDMFVQMDRVCVTREECMNLKPVSASTSLGGDVELLWKPFLRRCHYDCPSDYQEDENDRTTCKKCAGYCPKKCRGGQVDNIGEALKYSKCNIIEGSLELFVQISASSYGPEKFSEAFGEIQEITGNLVIRLSPAFTSLHMFKKLRKIHGQTLYQNRYALFIFENQNLRQLFNIERLPLSILNGTVYIQNNGLLCSDKINAFLDHVGLRNNVTDLDVSPYNNGEKAICDEVPLDVELVNVLSFAFMIRWSPFNTSDMDQRKFLGYQSYYKKVDHEDPDMSIDDDRSACADTWQTEFYNNNDDSKSTINGQMILDLEPNTLYAYYVRTRLVKHPGARSAISKLHFVRTLFGVPDPPIMQHAAALTSDQIILEWEPPIKTNGNITHYMVTWSAYVQDDVLDDPCIDTPITTIHVPKKAEIQADTCPADRGCCKCSDVKKPTNEEKDDEPDVETENSRLEKAQFENAVQNLVPNVKEESNAAGPSTSRARTLRSIIAAPDSDKDNAENDSKTPQASYANTFVVHNNRTVNQGRVNVTQNRLIIDHLVHYTTYHIQIVACQDVTAIENHCSGHAVNRAIRTFPLLSNDLVNTSTVEVKNIHPTDSNHRQDGRRIYWEIPENPNGYLGAFRVKVWRSDGNTPIEQCVNRSHFLQKRGVEFSGLSNGLYTLEIRTVSQAGTSEKVIMTDLFEVYVPGWLTWDKVIYITVAIIFVILAALGIGYRYIRRHYGKKVQEYLRSTISMNPEYCPIEIYKPDEWELKREDLILHEEIGRGTFGKVLRGTGNNITSVCGVRFGNCAVKTIPESANNAERLHFLIEASVMKQFNTAFIVKLYGVVSDGPPVLVVMEMMDQGNLRDYLRARRPDSEENINNAPLPTMINYFRWATQIADGMAYLESLKFCHRDLAARNCMISSDETVKIGDFGMARDIYYHEYYKPAGKRLMPVRWMAPESLRDGKFTVKSDVWSYGIVMYEMLTLGQQPYAGLGNDQVFNYIGTKRNILVKPQGCPCYWYDLMRICWRYDPRDRPCFYQIVLYLKQTVENNFQEHPHLNDYAANLLDRTFVMNNLDELDDDEYDFTYNEDDEEARKHNMLRELEALAAQEDCNYQYYKLGFGAPLNSAKEEREDDVGEDGDGGRFSMLTLQDLTHHEKPTDSPQQLSKKQIKAREKDRERINKKQRELELERQKNENDSSQPPEVIELKSQNSPKPAKKVSPPQRSASPTFVPVAVHIRDEVDEEQYMPTGGGSQYRPASQATTDVTAMKEKAQVRKPLIGPDS